MRPLVTGINWGAIDWGTFPAWVGAVGSTLAFGFSLLILFRQRDLLKAQRADIDHMRERARRAQAEQVAGRVKLETRTGWQRSGTVVYITNGSTASIRGCGVSLGYPPQFEPAAAYQFYPAVAPGETIEWVRPGDQEPWVIDRLQFTDSAGRHWINEGGLLTEADEGAPAGC